MKIRKKEVYEDDHKYVDAALSKKLNEIVLKEIDMTNILRRLK